jgi:hypothetical protein
VSRCIYGRSSLSSLSFLNRILNCLSYRLIKKYFLIQKKLVLFFFCCFFFSLKILAQHHIYEREFKRPDILHLSPQKIQEDSYWEKVRLAQFAYVAKVLELYPEQQLMFLARDGEYLYDVAKIVTEGTQDFRRIHYVNVSLANMKHPYLLEYLESFGFHEKALRAGESFVFIDTGLRGSIPKDLIKKINPQYAPQILTHLIVSEDHNIPSSRSFLFFLNPKKLYVPPHDYHEYILNYERLPRFYPQSNKFEKTDKGVFPAASIVLAEENISPEQALSLMKDLLFFWSQSSHRQWFYDLRATYKEAITFLKSGDLSQLPSFLARAQLRLGEKDLVKTLLIDCYEGLIMKGYPLSMSLEQLTLPKTALYDFVEVKRQALVEGDHFSSSEDVIQMFKKWIHFRQWNKIQKVIEGEFEFSFYTYLIKAFSQSEPTEALIEELRFFIKRNHFFLNKLIVEELVLKGSQNFDILVLDLVHTYDWYVIQSLIKSFFSLPRSYKQEKALIEILKTQNQGFIEPIIYEVFLRSHSLTLYEARKFFILNATPENLKLFIDLAEKSSFLSFSRPNLVLDWFLFSLKPEEKQKALEKITLIDKRSLRPRAQKLIEIAKKEKYKGSQMILFTFKMELLCREIYLK